MEIQPRELIGEVLNSIRGHCLSDDDQPPPLEEFDAEVCIVAKLFLLTDSITATWLVSLFLDNSALL